MNASSLNLAEHPEVLCPASDAAQDLDAGDLGGPITWQAPAESWARF